MHKIPEKLSTRSGKIWMHPYDENLTYNDLREWWIRFRTLNHRTLEDAIAEEKHKFTTILRAYQNQTFYSLDECNRYLLARYNITVTADWLESRRFGKNHIKVSVLDLDRSIPFFEKNDPEGFYTGKELPSIQFHGYDKIFPLLTIDGIERKGISILGAYHCFKDALPMSQMKD